MFEYSADRVDGGGALAGVTGAGYRTLHHNPAPLPHKEEMGGGRKWKEKTAKCGEGSNHLLAPVGRPARLPANFSSHVSCSGTSPRRPWPDQSDEALEWASNSYFLNERTQMEKKKHHPSAFFVKLSEGVVWTELRQLLVL